MAHTKTIVSECIFKMNSECDLVGRGTSTEQCGAPAPGTRHHMLLNSNEPPLDSDVRVIQLVISETDIQLTRLDGEIAQQRERLQQLEEAHDSLSSYRVRNRAILSPLRKMPPEVLGEIFSWTLPSVDEAWNREKFYITDSPWSLTHVNGRWRAVAISNPLLWSLISINYVHDLDRRSSYPLSMVETQIARARRLKVHFYGYQTSDFRPQVEIFQCLIKHSSRWEEFSLTLTSHLFPLLVSLRDRVALLRRMWIQWDAPDGQAAMEWIDCFQTAPSASDDCGAFIQSFTVSNVVGSTTVAPQLSSSSFGYAIETTIYYDAFLEMVKSRWKASHCALQRVAISAEAHHGLDAMMVKDLNELREEGLDLLLLARADAAESRYRCLLYTDWH
ncbi:hypothetical protein B0H19DRAFT_1112157 [Mycena capillaripes]|nr:hypothetical protein B0H19DRAFT_1112157 [Mycena capillaripes]